MFCLQGAAVVLGIHFSKCPTQQQRQRVRQTNDRRKYCFLWQVAYALPDEDRLTRKSIVSSEKKQSKADTELILIFGVLMPFSAVFQLYHGDQF
jgi:hypothetical protein